MSFTREDFRQYRNDLGFTTQEGAKEFLGAKDIKPKIDHRYIGSLNGRIVEILDRVQNVVSADIRVDDLNLFKKENLDKPHKIIKDKKILPKLNNWGRRREQFYFSWMRGYVFSCYFLKALGLVFDVDTSRIRMIGDDDLRKVETFKRTPKAFLFGKSLSLRLNIEILSLSDQVMLK